MINLDKLNSIDINNLDLAQLPQILADNQKVIVLIILAGSLALAGGMFMNNQKQTQALRAHISTEQTKIGVIGQRNQAVNDLNNFTSSLPKALNEFELINRISAIANANHVTIASLTPSDNKDAGLYDMTDVSFTAVADDFKDLLLFLRGLEDSKAPFRINSWSGSEGTDGKISSDIKLSAVHIHA